MRVLIASRKEVDIRRALEANCETLIVEEKNRTDIKRFVTREINDLKGKIRVINDLWGKIGGIAGPTAEEFFKTVAHNIVNQSEGARSIGQNTAVTNESPQECFCSLG